MVAINQLDNLPAATADTAETVPVDSTKLANADAIVLKSGDSKGSPVAIQAVALQAAPANYTVIFMNGTEKVAEVVSDGKNVTLPTEPTKAGTYRFAGWYTDAECTTAFDATNVTANITVYAKFNPYYLLGDVNLDGKITIVDYQDILKKVKRNATSYETGNEVTLDSGSKHVIGDVSGDGKITIVDYQDVLKNVKRKATKYDVGQEVK